MGNRHLVQIEGWMDGAKRMRFCKTTSCNTGILEYLKGKCSTVVKIQITARSEFMALFENFGPQVSSKQHEQPGANLPGIMGENHS